MPPKENRSLLQGFPIVKLLATWEDSIAYRRHISKQFTISSFFLLFQFTGAPPFSFRRIPLGIYGVSNSE